jgi:type II secretory pathway pseudopilin PulG
MPIKNRQQLLIIVAGAVFGLLIADALILSPLTKSWQARSKRITELRKQVDDGEKLLKRADALQSRWEQMQKNALPNNNSAAEQQVLTAFDKWSQDARISVNSITPQWKRDRDELLTLECRVDASGTVGTLAKFLYNVEHDPMALKIESVEVSTRDKDGQNLSLGLQVSGLVLNGTEERK